MRIIFMGTPDFALPSLKTLLDSEHTVAAVITQPDRPKGRGQHLTPPPVKVMAEAAGVPVRQPQKMKDPAFLADLTHLNPDLIVVVAFGRILPPSILQTPSQGCINVHASLLPQYRGAAPIAWAIIHGKKQTGITTIQMDEGLDSGAILLQETTEIIPSDTAGTLGIRLSEIGARVLLKTVDGIVTGTLKPIPQDHTQVTFAPLLDKDQGRVNWSLSANEISNVVRGFDPWPTAYTFYHKDRWKLWNAAARDVAVKEKPGTILKVGKEGIEVATGDGVLAIHELQPSNARRMSIKEYLAGHAVQEGIILEK